MKLSRSILLTPLLILFAVQAHSQDSLHTLYLNRTVASISTFNLLAGQFQLGLEKDFKKGTNSILLLGSVILDNYNLNGIEPSLGFQGEVHYRYKVLVRNNPQRRKEGRLFRFDFYASPFAQYQYLQSDDSFVYWDELGIQHFVDERLRMNSIGGGVVLGARFIFVDRISLDVYTGGGIKYTINGDDINDDFASYSYGVFQPGKTGIIPKGNIQFGIAF